MDKSRYDGRFPEPPYEYVCPSCALKDARIAKLEKVASEGRIIGKYIDFIGDDPPNAYQWAAIVGFAGNLLAALKEG